MSRLSIKMVFARRYRKRPLRSRNVGKVYTRGGKVMAMKKRLRYRPGSKGKIIVVRKLPEIAISSTATAGTALLTQNLTPGAPVCVTLGTPTLSVGSSGTSTSYDIPFSLQFALSQIINHTDITNLCDKYRIAGAYVRFYYNHTGSSGNSTAPFPYMQYITDHDDSNVPTIAQLREKMGLKFSTFQNQSSYIGMKCRPVPTGLVYSSALASGYTVPKYAPFLDCATDGVPHYSIKGVISNFNLPASAGIEVMKVDVALKIVAKDIQ